MRNASLKKITSGILLLSLILLALPLNVFAVVLTWTDQPAGNRGYTGVTSSSDGSKIAAAAYGGDIWTATGCGAGICTSGWYDHTESGAPTGKNWFGLASSADGTKIVGVEETTGGSGTGNIWIGVGCGSGACTSWTSQSSPGSKAWYAVAMSSDGSIVAAAVNSGDIWTGSGCTGGSCSWTDHSSGETGSPGSKAWHGIALSSDGSKLASAVLSGDIWTATCAGGGTCTTWTDHTAVADGGPTSKNWTGITSSADGTRIAAVEQSTPTIWIGVGCGSGACTSWTSQSLSASWTAISSSSDATKLVAVVTTGDIWIGINCTTTCTWTDQGTGAFGSTKQWYSAVMSADGTKVAAGIYVSGPSGDLWTGLIPSFGKKVKFATGQTFTINGLLNVNGVGGGLVTLSSTVGGTYWTVKPISAQNVSYVDVKDGACDAATTQLITAQNSIDDGHNMDNPPGSLPNCWNFLPTYSSINFNLSTTSVSFGLISSSHIRYATSDGLGFQNDSLQTAAIPAHQFIVATYPNSGYSVFVSGSTLTNTSSGHSLKAIGPVAASPVPGLGTEQFGLRVMKHGSTGNGDAIAPYDGGTHGGGTANGYFAFDPTAPMLVAQQTSQTLLSTTFDVDYVASASAGTDVGFYTTNLTYTAVPNF